MSSRLLYRYRKLSILKIDTQDQYGQNLSAALFDQAAYKGGSRLGEALHDTWYAVMLSRSYGYTLLISQPSRHGGTLWNKAAFQRTPY